MDHQHWQNCKALLKHWNTPLRGINKLSAQLVLGQNLRDSIPLSREQYKINNCWAHHIRKREISMNNTNAHIKELDDKHLKVLPDLYLGNNVLCQNTNNSKWDREGTIIRPRHDAGVTACTHANQEKGGLCGQWTAHPKINFCGLISPQPSELTKNYIGKILLS